jgi:hypothetical protein
MFKTLGENMAEYVKGERREHGRLHKRKKEKRRD